jgi:fatty acid desaturase
MMVERTTSERSHASTRAEIARLHAFEHWPGPWMWPMIVAMPLLGWAAAEAVEEYWPALVVIWPLQTVLMFVFVLAFHDASHGREHPVTWVNELYGHVLGTVTFIPLAVYRYAHSRHHAQLARPGDPELWPFNATDVSRPARMASAVAEIVFGVVYAPFLFLRSVLVGPVSARERRLIVRGYCYCAVSWALVILLSWWFDLWQILAASTLVPMTLAAMFQTLNKYEQHLGLHGESVLALTRTVVDRSRATELVSAAMLFNDYHGTHHRYAKIPFYSLPEATPLTLAGAEEPCPVYPSVVSATLDMLRCLADPKVGPQWLDEHQAAGRCETSRAASEAMVQPEFTGAYQTPIAGV